MDKDSMDAITFTSEEDDEFWKIVDERMNRMVDYLLREDEGEEDNEEQKQAMCVGVSEESIGKRDVLEDDTAFSGAENQMDSSTQLDERGDEDDDSAWRRNEPGKKRLRLIRDAPKGMDEEKNNEFWKKVEEIKRMDELEMEEFWSDMDYFLTIKDLEWEMEEFIRERLEAYCWAYLEREELKWETEDVEREELERLKKLAREGCEKSEELELDWEELELDWEELELEWDVLKWETEELGREGCVKREELERFKELAREGCEEREELERWLEELERLKELAREGCEKMKELEWETEELERV